jgi:hypothetical protein
MNRTVFSAGVLSAVVFACNANANCLYESITALKPDNIYLDLANGAVLDLETGLVWARCLLGQTWDDRGTPADYLDDTCEPDMNLPLYPWSAALQAAQTANSAPLYLGLEGWRVPSAKELASLVEPACTPPPWNPRVFGGSSYCYWSSTPSGEGDRYAWLMSIWGEIFTGLKSGACLVRLVRDGS